MNWKRVIFRTLLVAGGLAYVAAASVNLAGAWLRDHPTPENLRRGIAWNPADAELWFLYAHDRMIASQGSGSPEAAQSYRRAAALNPLEPQVWDGLGTVYHQMGETQKTEAALRSWLAATPHSPQAAWRLANFLLLQDRIPEALPLLRTAALFDPNLRFAVFDLGWKLMDDPETIFRDLVADDLQVRGTYLEYLLWRGKLPEAAPVWKQIREAGTELDLRLGYRYVDALAEAGFGAEAADLWKDLLESAGRAWAKPEGDWLTNGDFEADLPNDGLHWRLAQGPGYAIALDAFVSQHGTRSLRVTFDGTSNPAFAGISELVPVEPNVNYRFQGYLKAENITTNSGVFFSLASAAAPPQETFEHSTENSVGSSSWELERIDFRTGAHTRFIRVSLRRDPSHKLDNQIQGKAWIDNLSLTRRPD